MPQIAIRLLPALMPVLLLGCTVGPDYRSAPPPAVDRFTETALPEATAQATVPGGAAQRFVAGQDIARDWWTAFHAPKIDALVAQALAANPDLAAAQASLREAQQNMRAEQGALLPKVTGAVSAQRQRESLAAAGFGTGTNTFSVVNGALNVSYTLDAFGGVRRQIEQLGAQTAYARAERDATELTLAANVVATAIRIASIQAQLDTTQAILRSETAALELTQRRFALGGVSRVDVLQQQALRDAEQATLPGLQKQLSQQRNQLAIYLGHVPSDASLPTITLAELTLPADLPVSLPSKLVEQRPDIRAYAALVHAASAGVGVAVANMLPQISLTASYGRAGNTSQTAFTPDGIVWSLASGLTQPIFDAGTLRAQRNAAQEAYAVAAANYSSTVDIAFQNVADSLVAIERDAETLQATAQSEQTAAASLSLAQMQYRAGAAPYLSVLTAELSAQTARLALVTAQAARFTDTVALLQALGGGWWNRTDAETPDRSRGVAP